MTEVRELTRQKILERTQVLDDAARIRRQKKALEALERDNFQDTPTYLVSESKLQINRKFQQKFNVDETNNENSNVNGTNSNENQAKKRKLKPESKLRFRKTLNNLIEEEQLAIGEKKINYFSICVPPSKFPPRKFCSVCGFPSSYTCVQCGTKYCSSKCLQTHKDTRCLKWTA